MAESQAGDVQKPEKGSMNADGSVNLGFRKAIHEPATYESRPSSTHSAYGHRQPSPHSAMSDLAAYQQQSLRPRNMASNSFNDDNRLPPIQSMQGTNVDRQSSISPASFISAPRKRSFSSAEEQRQHDEGTNDPKRLSSIKSILNPSQGGSRHEQRNDFSLPPLRSPGTTIQSAPSPGLYSSRDPTPALSDHPGENEHRAERRAALQREAERMREMLAAKERELMDLGE